MFQEGEQVLVLLPTSSNKLLAQWQGPYKIVKKVRKLNYQIDMHDKRKRKRIFHVNMLRKWYDDPPKDTYADVDDTEFEELTSSWKENMNDKHEIPIEKRLDKKH